MNELFDAIRNGDATQVHSLMAADPGLADARNESGATPALWAVYTRHADLAPIVLGGREPDLFEACALGGFERVTQFLADDPHQANAVSADGFGALGLAVYFGHLTTARRLVEAGADVNAPSQNSFRVTPLHSAVASGSLPLLELLLNHGAAPDPVEFLEATPLHSAAAGGSRGMVERLLAAGADRMRRTKEGKTAADLARESGHPEIAALLE